MELGEAQRYERERERESRERAMHRDEKKKGENAARA